MLAHGAVHHRQPKARPLPWLLGGEEWLKNLPLDLLCHPRAGVCDGQPDIASRSGIRVGVGGSLVQFDLGRGDLEFASVGHSVTGIDGQI